MIFLVSGNPTLNSGFSNSFFVAEFDPQGEVIWAETGEDALSFIETEDDLDLVLLDMQLPDINGDQVARIVRSREEFNALPLVALTANVRRAEEIALLEVVNLNQAKAIQAFFANKAKA